MAEKFKTTFKAFLAGQYETVPDFYNEMSEKGWQVIKTGCFHQKFKFDENARYRYKFDFRKKPDDFGRYIETFREQGWEYINSSFNGWHAFRKAYNPALPESEYEIYTDTESSKEMRKRTANIITIAALAAAVGFAIFSVYTALAFTIVSALMWLGYGILLYFGVLNLISVSGKKLKLKSRTWLFALLLVAFIGSSVLSLLRPGGFNMSAEEMGSYKAEIDENTCFWVVHVKYPDFYCFDFDIDADNPATLSLVDSESGETVYTTRGDDVSEENVRKWLTPGEYRIYLSDFAGGKININCVIN